MVEVDPEPILVTLDSRWHIRQWKETREARGNPHEHGQKLQNSTQTVIQAQKPGGWEATMLLTVPLCCQYRSHTSSKWLIIIIIVCGIVTITTSLCRG